MKSTQPRATLWAVVGATLLLSAGAGPLDDATSDEKPEKEIAQPRSSERQDDREAMVRTQIQARGVADERVLQAMRDVPRHWFVPKTLQMRAYADTPLPIGHEQTISQPFIVALMTELLALSGEEKVLEIGTGSGYQAAVLAELVQEVHTIEIVEPLGERAKTTLAEKGYNNVHVRIGDGYQGWPEQAPFDAIIVTCAPESPPEPLVAQLAVGGRMCIPLGPDGGIQKLVLLTKKADGSLQRRDIEPVRFVPMTGRAKDNDRD
jgi:protein-L-isoaspartate(D-aspartate) O-methyltransferase